MLRYEPRRQLRLVTVRKSIHILDREHWRSGPRREDRDALLEPNVGISHAAKQGFDEGVDILSGLICQIGESGFERYVDGDRGGRHR
jgi:hypothetical protein